MTGGLHEVEWVMRLDRLLTDGALSLAQIDAVQYACVQALRVARWRITSDRDAEVDALAQMLGVSSKPGKR